MEAQIIALLKAAIDAAKEQARQEAIDIHSAIRRLKAEILEHVDKQTVTLRKEIEATHKNCPGKAAVCNVASVENRINILEKWKGVISFIVAAILSVMGLRGIPTLP